MNYISMPWISDTFREEYLDNTTSRNAILRYNYENLFIMKFGVGYAYNNGIIAIKANAETAGNLLGLMARTFGFHRNNDDQYTFLDVAYAQYVKVDLEALFLGRCQQCARMERAQFRTRKIYQS